MSEILLNSFDVNKYVTPKINGKDVISKIFGCQQAQIDLLNGNIKDIIDNIFIDTATWSLELWENELGLPVFLNDNLENRRSRIKSRLRGYGVCTKKHIKNVALSYGCGDVEPIEHFEDYLLEIKFISKVGVPANMNDFKKTMRLITPAHIGLKYTFKYNTWNDIKEACIIYGYTWNYLKEKGITWNDLKNKDLSTL